MKVGGTIWRFDINHRVYPPTPEGKLWPNSGPIYKHHWRETTITGETSRSWVTNYGKVSKNGDHPGWAFTQEEVDNDCWVHGERYRIASAVMSCVDAAALRKIAELIGHSPSK